MLKSDTKQLLAASNSRFALTFIALAIVLFVSALVTLSIGHYSYNPLDVLRVIGDAIQGKEQADPSMGLVLVNIRLPRLIAALIVGSALSMSGAVYQGVFRNPLVSPNILGGYLVLVLAYTVGFFYNFYHNYRNLKILLAATGILA